MNLIFILILLVNIINSLLFKAILSTNKFRNITVFPSEEGLYTIKVKIGTPSKEFSLLLDTCSPLLWINSNDCDGCISKNAFISSQSNSFYLTNEIININYLSGEINGNICKDTIDFAFNDSKIKNFNFILVNKTNLNFSIDGIFGLSKGVNNNIKKVEYSTINQLYNNHFINKNIFLFDFPKNNFYMGEIPEYLNNYNNFSCSGNYRFNYWNCFFEKLIFNNNDKLNSNTTNNDNTIIFNSGTNCLIFPVNFIKVFESIISENKILRKGKCFIKSEDSNNTLYSLFCYNNISNLVNENNKELHNIYLNDEFIIFYLNKNNKISFKLIDLYNKNEDNFKLYFTRTPNKAVILGIPFFEKYTISFNKGINEVIIYGEKNNIEKSNLLLKILIGISIIIILILIILLIFCCIRRKQPNSKQMEKQFSQFEFIQQES